jgi:hypothetical protein
LSTWIHAIHGAVIDLAFWGALIAALLLRNALALLIFPGSVIAVLALTNWRATLLPLTPIQLRRNRTRAAIQTVAGCAAIALLAYFAKR